jgi:glutathione S-transferase
MAQTTLTYFDFSSSRGEDCRLALHLAGVPFVDERLKPAEWQQRKPHTPFGALPVLTVEGHPPLAQTNAILRLIGREHGLLPADPWQAARHEAIMDAVEDLRQHMGPLARIKDEAEKRRAREEAAAGYLPTWAAQIERQIGAGPFVGGERIGVADLKLFVAMTPYLRGSIDFVPPTVFDGAPRLKALFEAVKNHPSVVAWYARSH